jgi:hypoxanthine phosphoribosyltransferase
VTPPFRVLIPQLALQRRVRELAAAIATDYAHEPPCLVAVMEGARRFARLLTRHLPIDVAVHEIRASSYGDGTHSSGIVKVLTGHDVPVEGRDVLVLEDIVDTGRTIAALGKHLLGSGAATMRVATLLDKPARRAVPVELHYVGFCIPDEFVIGFGMDVAGRYRELDDVVIYDPACEQDGAG